MHAFRLPLYLSVADRNHFMHFGKILQALNISPEYNFDHLNTQLLTRPLLCDCVIHLIP